MALHCLICKNSGATAREATWPRMALAALLLLPLLLATQVFAAGAGQVDATLEIAPAWRPLAKRLASDGLAGPEVDKLLASLGQSPTQSPMGRKMRELYRRQFLGGGASGPKRQKYYKGVVTEANAKLCREYIAAHKEAFEAASARYGVPPNIACALLFVETRLGKVLGDVPENAFYTLASMAVSTKPRDISGWLDRMPGYARHMGWMEETMRKRADWAYNETRALIRHMLRDGIAPSGLPGSIYGAVGLCQFMPSNITPYGADGDGDGRVDLFNPPDAIASLANYLRKHGWRPDLSAAKRHKVLMSYNHSTVYANTILALAGLIGGEAKSASPKKRKAAS